MRAFATERTSLLETRFLPVRLYRQSGARGEGRALPGDELHDALGGDRRRRPGGQSHRLPVRKGKVSDQPKTLHSLLLHKEESISTEKNTKSFIEIHRVTSVGVESVSSRVLPSSPRSSLFENVTAMKCHLYHFLPAPLPSAGIQTAFLHCHLQTLVKLGWGLGKEMKVTDGLSEPRTPVAVSKGGVLLFDLISFPGHWEHDVWLLQPRSREGPRLRLRASDRRCSRQPGSERERGPRRTGTCSSQLYRQRASCLCKSFVPAPISLVSFQCPYCCEGYWQTSGVAD